MNDYQALAVPTLILLAIVGGALVGWALRRETPYQRGYRLGRAAARRYFNRDNPYPDEPTGI